MESLMSIRTIHSCVSSQLAKGLKCREVVTLALHYALGRRPNEKDESFLDNFGLWANTYRSRAFGTDDDAWPLNSLECSFGTFLLELGPDHGELFYRRIIKKGRGRRSVSGLVQLDVMIVDGVHLLLGNGCVIVGEHRSEGGYILKFGGKSCANDVVRRCHALNDI